MPPDVAERQKKLNAWMRQRISLFKRAGFSAVLYPPTPSSEDSAIAAADSETQKSTEATPESAEPSPATEEAKTDSESAGVLAKVEAEVSSEPAKPKPTTIDTHFLAVTVTPFVSTAGSLSFEIADADVGDWDSVPELWVTANVREQQADLIISAARKAAEDAEKTGKEQRKVRGVLWILIICDMVPHLHPIIVWEDEAEKEKARREAEGKEEEEDWEQRLKDACKLGSGQPRSPVSEEVAATA
ncbi:hypothetical protein FS837_001076 [Tulasnella sp. UAMH 9824]|nr:hypothetical protein FS837_001076 [Tulasnella sp. UAMH 9824]